MKVDIDTSVKLYADAWLGFKGTDWKNEINVRDFIQHNYTPYEGDESCLAEATPATTELWEKVMEGMAIAALAVNAEEMFLVVPASEEA